MAANIPFNGSTPTDGSGTSTTAPALYTAAPNELWSYDQATYHFRFYLTDDRDGSQSITIAESGITTLNIQSVTIDTTIGPNMQTKNTLGTNVTIKILEPYGALLPDQMLYAARELGIQNYYKTPWKLDLRFMGYDDLTGTTHGLDNLGPWTWNLLLINTSTTVSESGSAIHTIEAVPYQEVALANQYAILPINATPKGDTVGDVLKNLATTLNDDQMKKFGVLFTEYAFADQPYKDDTVSGITSPFMHRILPTDPQHSDNRNQEGGQFSSGTDIPSIVDVLFASSKTATEQAMLSRSIEPQNQDQIQSVVSIMHRVDTKVEQLDFDPILGDYKKKITFIVKPYDTLRLMTNISSAQSYAGTADVQTKKLAYANQKNYLKKEYNYLYTGKNTDIERFDINLNFRWQIAVPILLGQFSYGTTTVPREFDENLIKKLQNLTQQLNQNYKKLQLTQDQISNPPADPDESTTKTLQDTLDQLNKQNSTLQQQIAQGRADLAKQARTPTPKTPSSNYAEDLLSSGTPFIPPITLMQDGENPSVQTQWGTTNNSDSSKSIYGTLLNQLYGSGDANLLQIELMIRGDPYWLGPDAETVQINLANNSDPVSTSSYASFNNGEHMFAFKFKLPQGTDPDTGQVKLQNDDIYTGFYAAYKVTNNFNAGVFTQNLTAVRVPGMTLNTTSTPTNSTGG